MDVNNELQDWELLQGSDSSVAVASDDDAKGFEDGDYDNGIKADYFAPDSSMRSAGPVDSEEESPTESDNPSWVDPDSDSRYSGGLQGELGMKGIEFSGKKFDGQWTSDESSDDDKSIGNPRKKEFELEKDVGFQISEGDLLDEYVGGFIDSGKDGDGIEIKKVYSEDIVPGDTKDSIVRESSSGNRQSKKFPSGSVEKEGMNWWKHPMEFLKFYIFKIRPVWSISIAAALMGAVMLGKKLYQINHKAHNISFKLRMDNKRASLFAVQTGRLNEAFSVVKRLPVMKTTLPMPGTAAWPVLALR